MVNNYTFAALSCCGVFILWTIILIFLHPTSSLTPSHLTRSSHKWRPWLHNVLWTSTIMLMYLKKTLLFFHSYNPPDNSTCICVVYVHINYCLIIPFVYIKYIAFRRRRVSPRGLHNLSKWSRHAVFSVTLTRGLAWFSTCDKALRILGEALKEGRMTPVHDPYCQPWGLEVMNLFFLPIWVAYSVVVSVYDRVRQWPVTDIGGWPLVNVSSHIRLTSRKWIVPN